MKLIQTLKLSFLLFFSLLVVNLFAQGKKVLVYELDKINGVYIQQNTIGPFSGIAYDEYANGKKSMEIPIKEGKQNGVAKEWAKNGKKTYEATYRNGVQEGIETQWYASGKKKLEVTYGNGVPNGMVKEWHRVGSKKSEGIFKNGKEDGEHKWWYSTGGLDQVITYVDGRANGLVKNWYENGQLWIEKEYKEGQQDGKYQEWYMKGMKKIEGIFTAGKENGTFLYWSKTELLEGKQIFENGKLVKDYNYRSGSLNIHKGYIEVFNGKESFYAIKITGNDVERKRVDGITYVIDGKLLQLFKTPISDFHKGDIAEAKDMDLLKEYLVFEKDYIAKETQTSIEVSSEIGKTNKGLEYLYWSFDSPSAKEAEQTPSTVKEEHYVSLVCGEYIISLYSVITNGETSPSSISGMLKHLAKDVRIEAERIDLNQVAQKLYGLN